MFIKVGARKFEVNFIENDQVLETNDDAYGYIDYNSSKIIIKSKSTALDFQAETLIHEILHSLLDNGSNENINTEEVVKALTPRLHAFFIDNPLFQEQILKMV